jgi:O-antigen/teichoic acid export membrane protein
VNASGAERPSDSLRGQLVRGVAANILGRLLSMAAWLFVTRLLVGSLGPDRFGFWSLVSTLVFFSLTIDFGLSPAVTRFVAAHRAGGDEAAMRGVVALGFAGSLLLGCAWLGAALLLPGPLLRLAHVAPSLRQEALPTLDWMGVAFLFNLLALVPSAALSGFQRFDLVNRNLVLSTLVQLAAMLVVIRRGAGMPELAMAIVLGSLVSLALSWFTLRHLWPGLGFASPRSLRPLLQSFGGFGIALQVIYLGSLALYQMPKFLFASMLSLAAVGQFELGYRVAFSAWSIPTLLLPPLLPAASHLESTGERDRLWRLYERASRLLLPLAFTLAAGLVALAKPLFAAWLGPGFGQAAGANIAIAVLLGVNVLTSAGCLVARGMGRPWWEAGYLAIAFVLQAALGWWLIGRRAFDGGLLAMVIAGTLGTAWFLVVYHRAMSQSLVAFVRRVVVAPLAAAVLGGLAGWAVSGGPWSDASQWPRGRALLALGSGGITLVVVAGLVLFATRALTLDEVRQLVATIREKGESAGAGA